ncbi:MAG: N-acetylmuramoyl-L-alanine amidase [Clostridiaceae bacterium]|nr:N-acetylmuramoyl-L-alanine amidase [Clostridiaceae bacterium]
MIINFINQSDADSKKQERLVIIDAGHGGSDPGATSPIKGLLEREVALDVSRKLNVLLKETGFKTYMTRENDVAVSLRDRVTVANKLEADLFVSVHANAAMNTRLATQEYRQLVAEAMFRAIATYFEEINK